MKELHWYGLIRFSKRTGKIDMTMTGHGKGMLELWALQNTTKSKACVIVDIDTKETVIEYIGASDFPEVRKSDFEYALPLGLLEIFEDEVRKRTSSY